MVTIQITQQADSATQPGAGLLTWDSRQDVRAYDKSMAQAMGECAIVCSRRLLSPAEGCKILPIALSS